MNRARGVIEEACKKYLQSGQSEENDMHFLNELRKIQKKEKDALLFLCAEYSEDIKRAAFLSGFEAGIKAALELCKKI